MQSTKSFPFFFLNLQKQNIKTTYEHNSDVCVISRIQICCTVGRNSCCVNTTRFGNPMSCHYVFICILLLEYSLWNNRRKTRSKQKVGHKDANVTSQESNLWKLTTWFQGTDNSSYFKYEKKEIFKMFVMSLF